MNLPVEVIEAVRGGRCVLFLGSNAGREVAELAGGTWPEGKELARILGWQRPKVMPGARPKPVMPSVSAGAELYEKKLGRAALVAALRAHVGAEGLSPGFAHAYALERFPLIFTTCWDDLLERSAGDRPMARLGFGDAVPDMDASRRVLYRWRGSFARPESLVITDADRARREFPAELKTQIRNLIRRNVLFFVGYRPDEEEFEQLWEDLTVCYGGELPRCHLAVSQGTIDDYQWQRWVWRGLLLFHADPIECMEELQRRIAEGA